MTKDTTKQTRAEPDQKVDPEFEKALAEKDGQLSVQEQAKIDAALGDGPEGDFSEEDVATKKGGIKDANLIEGLKAFTAQYGSGSSLISKLVQVIPADTPDDYIIGGHSDQKLRLGHLRALVVGIG